MGQVVSEQQVSEFPLVTRDFTQILGLSAGVTMDVTNAADLGKRHQSADSSYTGTGGKNVHRYAAGR